MNISNHKNWKRKLKIATLGLLILALSGTVGCAKYGCPNMADQNLSKKRYKSKSSLFDKKTGRKMGTRK